MLNMQEIAFKRAINALTALKCQFAVITPEGEKFGELQVINKIPSNRHKMGEMKAYVEPYLESVEVGQEFSVPCGEHSMKLIARSVGNWFYKKHGPGSFNYRSDRYTNSIHGIRIK